MHLLECVARVACHPHPHGTNHHSPPTPSTPTFNCHPRLHQPSIATSVHTNLQLPPLSTPTIPHRWYSLLSWTVNPIDTNPPSLSTIFFFFFIALGLELSDTRVYEPEIRALLGAASHSCKAVVLTSRTVPSGTIRAALPCQAQAQRGCNRCERSQWAHGRL